MTHRWDDCLAALQAEGRLPSVVAGISRAGEQVWQGAAGSAPAPTADTSYRIGSITKTLTAVLALQLRDEGRLRLDDPVGTHVAETAWGDATLRGLLSHTAGLPSEPVGPWWERSAGVPTPDLLAANDASRRVAPAGDFFHYSNLGYGLLGEVVARLCGASWWEVVQERLLGPLGMGATTYDAPPGAATGWSVDHFAGTLTPEPSPDTVAMAPAGQLWSTIADLLRWADFLAVGHPDVLSASTLAEMRGHHPPADSYGLGLRLLQVGGHTMIGHTGSMPGFMASLFVDPLRRDAVAVLTNATTGLGPELVPARFLGGEPASAPTQPWRPTSGSLPDDVTAALGLWFWGNTAFALEWWGDELRVRDLRTGQVTDRFGWADGRLVGTEGYHRGEHLEVRRRDDGAISHLECATFVYTRTPYDPAAPIPGGHPA